MTIRSLIQKSGVHPEEETMKLSEIMLRVKDLEMAFRAIGGREFRQERCECDYEVGFVPCEYCAIHKGLTVGSECFSELREITNGKV
jgi:hypothetical protein